MPWPGEFGKRQARLAHWPWQVSASRSRHDGLEVRRTEAWRVRLEVRRTSAAGARELVGWRGWRVRAGIVG
jgi:hypothetical protein